MKIIITGGTGFIGRQLAKKLSDDHHQIIILTRNALKSSSINDQISFRLWDGKTAEGWISECSGEYGLINLAGENIGKGRWTMERKRQMLESRVNAGKAITEAVLKAETKPKVIIQASAIGYYDGYSGELCDENSAPGQRFLSDLSSQWENSVSTLKNENTRLIFIRTGVVLGKEAGIIPQISLSFKLYLGGKIGSGKQWFSWIHIDDEIGAIRFLIDNEKLSGVYNLTAPEPVRMEFFLKTLAKIIKRPYWLTSPSFIISLIFGEMGRELILSGERVSGAKLANAGYHFNFDNLEMALKDILGKNV